MFRNKLPAGSGLLVCVVFFFGYYAATIGYKIYVVISIYYQCFNVAVVV